MPCRLSGISIFKTLTDFKLIGSVPCRENGYENQITLIRGKVEEVQLPVDKVHVQQFKNGHDTAPCIQVDVIVSEWMVSALSTWLQ